MAKDKNGIARNIGAAFAAEFRRGVSDIGQAYQEVLLQDSAVRAHKGPDGQSTINNEPEPAKDVGPDLE